MRIIATYCGLPRLPVGGHRLDPGGWLVRARAEKKRKRTLARSHRVTGTPRRGRWSRQWVGTASMGADWTEGAGFVGHRPGPPGGADGTRTSAAGSD